METIDGGKTPGLCLVEALPAEVVALGISICDTARDGSGLSAIRNLSLSRGVSTSGPVIRAGPAVCCQIEAAVRSRAEALSARLAPLSQRVSRISSAHADPP